MPQLYFDNLSISYELIRSSRAKRLRLEIRPGGFLTIITPQTLSEVHAFHFVRKKSLWIKKYVQKLKDKNPPLLGKSNRKDFLFHKSAALSLALSRLAHFNDFYNYTISKVVIRMGHTRWGSCSRKGNLNFNYRILFLPPALRDYLIVHELCHLGEFNHSQKFWALVARTLPDYKNLRQALKAY
ncbi:MAG: M48 family metallopeptidase [Candidatus Harrisonbacteria bacterium]|nr:M48 family metallopeptidase [Candidatus Harrisonbacteria bacterium]